MRNKNARIKVHQVGQLFVGDVHHSHPAFADTLPPPEKPDLARQCPQCQKATWRYTPVCLHCRLDARTWAFQRGWQALCGWVQGR